MKKIFLTLLIACSVMLSIEAKDSKRDFSTVIKDSGVSIESIAVSIKNATLHEQNIFNDAMRELLSPMDNPRYIIIKKRVFNKKKYDYKYSFACPKKFAINNENVETFKQNLIKSIGNIDIKYVYSEEGRKLLVKCQKESFISRNDKYINKRQKSY